MLGHISTDLNRKSPCLVDFRIQTLCSTTEVNWYGLKLCLSFENSSSSIQDLRSQANNLVFLWGAFCFSLVWILLRHIKTYFQDDMQKV